MRIDNNLANAVGVGGSSTAPVRQTSPEGRIPAHEDENGALDTVKLSNAGNLVALAKQAGAADRQARIALLTKQVQSGTYQPNLEDVTRAILKGESSGIRR